MLRRDFPSKANHVDSWTQAQMIVLVHLVMTVFGGLIKISIAAFFISSWVLCTSRQALR